MIIAIISYFNFIVVNIMQFYIPSSDLDAPLIEY